MHESELPPLSERPVLRIGAVHFNACHTLANVLEVIGALGSWAYADIEPPTRSAIVRAKEVVLAVGPLTPGGPDRVLVAPSVRGGVVVTFDRPAQRDVTVAAMNNRTDLLVLGRGWTGQIEVLEVDHAEALERARELGRS
jgi:hypothetical protein